MDFYEFMSHIVSRVCVGHFNDAAAVRGRLGGGARLLLRQTHLQVPPGPTLKGIITLSIFFFLSIFLLFFFIFFEECSWYISLNSTCVFC